MKRLLLLCILLSASLWLQAQRVINEEEVSLATTKGELKGTLRDPGENAPLALIIAGSGPTDRDGNNPLGVKANTYKYIAEELYQQGIATLCFDKRGIGASASALIEEKDLLFTQNVDDVNDWIKWLLDSRRFSSISIIGHSEGSLVGMLAAKDNPSIAKYISISGPASSADHLLKQQLAAQPEPVKSQVYEIIDQLKAGKEVSDIPAYLEALFRSDIQPYMISWFKYTPSDVLRSLKQPVLIVQGTTDIQVDENQAMLLLTGKPTAQMLLIKDMNHVLKSCSSTDQLEQMKTYTDPDLPLPIELVEGLSRFILNM